LIALAVINYKNECLVKKIYLIYCLINKNLNISIAGIRINIKNAINQNTYFGFTKFTVNPIFSFVLGGNKLLSSLL